MYNENVHLMLPKKGEKIMNKKILSLICLVCMLVSMMYCVTPVFAATVSPLLSKGNYDAVVDLGAKGNDPFEIKALRDNRGEYLAIKGQPVRNSKIYIYAVEAK